MFGEYVFDNTGPAVTVNPETTTRRYKVIKVDDYSKQIESSINSLDSILKNVSFFEMLRGYCSQYNI